MKNAIILLMLFVMSCNQVSGADEFHFPDENDESTDTTVDAGDDAPNDAGAESKATPDR